MSDPCVQLIACNTAALTGPSALKQADERVVVLLHEFEFRTVLPGSAINRWFGL